MRIMVITPTTGKPIVERAIVSVANQTVLTEHLLVLDGPVKLDMDFPNNLKAMQLPENVGGNGWYGHRVYAAMPLLVNADYILFLDEDNWLEPTHVETMVKTIQDNDLMWAYSLRRLYNDKGEYLFDDDGESLGKYPTFYDPNEYFVDTNCYCFKREYLIPLAHCFYNQWGADRIFYRTVKQYLPKFECTGEATVNYTLADKFHESMRNGMAMMNAKYNGNFPWRKK